MEKGRAELYTQGACSKCPRKCNTDRKNGKYGYCNSSDRLSLAAICLHRGEEPVLSGDTGMCNIFFTHCNLQCIYCQNFQISRNDTEEKQILLEEALDAIEGFLDAGITCVGFVAPSHDIPQMKSIIDGLRCRARHPVYVMNTSAYDLKETIESLEGFIDVYLPDFKYMDERLARDYSGAMDYPSVALRALREMYRQKGSNLRINGKGMVESGFIIRHLILPGHVENSVACLRAIAEELSPSVHVSLMSQYHPVKPVHHHSMLGRTITREEYDMVVEEFYRLGFHRGWVQEFESHDEYLPDFDKDHPF
ncbi:MAG: radical SAM protein [Spirochaetae bacterium HGW-Spirochaetae-1]|nr:MAG: radical SAM protein [Spirochaetae bacterium HGW-Spirochaetae-1]